MPIIQTRAAAAAAAAIAAAEVAHEEHEGDKGGGRVEENGADTSLNWTLIHLVDVARLRQELEKRGLDTKGGHCELAERLQAAVWSGKSSPTGMFLSSEDNRRGPKRRQANKVSPPIVWAKQTPKDVLTPVRNVEQTPTKKARERVRKPRSQSQRARKQEPIMENAVDMTPQTSAKLRLTQNSPSPMKISQESKGTPTFTAENTSQPADTTNSTVEETPPQLAQTPSDKVPQYQQPTFASETRKALTLENFSHLKLSASSLNASATAGMGSNSHVDTSSSQTPSVSVLKARKKKISSPDVVVAHKQYQSQIPKLQQKEKNKRGLALVAASIGRGKNGKSSPTHGHGQQLHRRNFSDKSHSSVKDKPIDHKIQKEKPSSSSNVLNKVSPKCRQEIAQKPHSKIPVDKSSLERNCAKTLAASASNSTHQKKKSKVGETTLQQNAVGKAAVSALPTETMMEGSNCDDLLDSIISKQEELFDDMYKTEKDRQLEYEQHALERLRKSALTTTTGLGLMPPLKPLQQPLAQTSLPAPLASRVSPIFPAQQQQQKQHQFCPRRFDDPPTNVSQMNKSPQHEPALALDPTDPLGLRAEAELLALMNPLVPANEKTSEINRAVSYVPPPPQPPAFLLGSIAEGDQQVPRTLLANENFQPPQEKSQEAPMKNPTSIEKTLSFEPTSQHLHEDTQTLSSNAQNQLMVSSDISFDDDELVFSSSPLDRSLLRRPRLSHVNFSDYDEDSFINANFNQ